MRSGLRGWFRLTVVVSGLWLVGMAIYAALAYRYPYDISAPFVHTDRSVGRVYFDERMFIGLTAAGFAALWMLCLGLPWVIRGFLSDKTSS
jgi:hypothetical protein